ncbi:uncharacterized protein LOC134208809 [Armigeres subalbatus]|uniref:uncharacterized protein LOC134208809 n=1 Tax=Armigeres subalbatus TaxID=124917 RepID=UPI002ED33585
MDVLAERLDQETIAVLKGFRCHMAGCKRLIPGHVVELKRHFKFVHGLNVTGKSDILFRCSECGASYSYFKTLKRHLITSHPDIKPYSDVRPTVAQQEEHVPVDQTETDIAQKRCAETDKEKKLDASRTKEALLVKIRNFVTSMRIDTSLPESKIRDFMVATANIIQCYQQHTEDVFKQFLNDKAIPVNDEVAVNALNDMKLDKLFEEVRTADENLSYLSSLAGSAVPIPKEIILGKRTVKKLVNLEQQLGKKPKRIRSITVEKDTAHYVSILDTLSLVMRSKAAQQMVANEDCFASFRDGNQYKQNDFLKNHPNSIRLSLHVDDVEYVNPLGSRKTKQKLTLISFKIENMHPAKNASPSRVYLALTVRSSHVKTYGYQTVLQPLLTDLKMLESGDAEKVNDRALLLLTDAHLQTMGITAAGPRIIILSTIEELQTNLVAPVAREESEDATQQLSREMFEGDGYFRNKYLYKTLDANIIPDQNGLHALTRIAAKKLSTRILDGGRYPEIHEMVQLAKEIINLFPILERTRLHNTAPPESFFFWIHGGKERGPHTGVVYHHLRNTIRKLPKQMLKFQRKRKLSEESEPISDELYERALVLTRLPSPSVEAVRGQEEKQVPSRAKQAILAVYASLLMNRPSVDDGDDDRDDDSAANEDINATPQPQRCSPAQKTQGENSRRFMCAPSTDLRCMLIDIVPT